MRRIQKDLQHLQECRTCYIVFAQKFKISSNTELLRAGLQEESTWYGLPTIVFRDKTERPEAAMAGLSIIAGEAMRWCIDRSSRWPVILCLPLTCFEWQVMTL